MVAAARSHAASRFTLEDSRFLRAFHSEIPISIGHALWHFDGPVPAETLTDLHRRVADSPLSRVVVPPRIPGARHRWARATSAPPIRRTASAIDPDGVQEWIDHTARTAHFHPTRGPLWDLSWTLVTDGSTVVMLSGAHLATDGPEFLGVVTEIGAGRAISPLPSAPRPWPRLRDDLRDAADRVRTFVGVGGSSAEEGAYPAVAAHATTPLIRVPGSRAAARTRGTRFDYSPPWVIADCETEALISAARRYQGTINSLFIAIGATLAGPTDDGRSPVVHSAVSRRAAGDLWTANTTRAAAIDAPADELARRDLAGIRRRCKTGYAETVAQPTESRLSIMLQAMPHAVYRRLPAIAPEVVSSFMGMVPVEATSIGGQRASSTTFFASFRCRSAEDIAPIASGPGLWLTLHGTRASLYATAFGRGDIDRDSWRDEVLAALDYWDVPATIR